MKIIVALLAFCSIFQVGCSSQRKLLNPGNPVFAMKAPAEFKVQLETSKGDIILEVRRPYSSNGADHFYNLVRYGFYDKAKVFQLRAGVWPQFGIAADP